MLPNLIHPIPVTIQRQLAAATTFDARARGPVRQLWKKGQGPGTGEGETIYGQVDFNNPRKQYAPKLDPGGVEEKSIGYALFRVVDLIDAGMATENESGTVTFGIKRGDRITRIGRRDVAFYVTYFRDVASYDDQGGATLLEVNFSDRNPDQA